ncbi:uncharacterized protein F5Z01DRAFT_228582 [Emericellopsis atlantica]|uniref:Uncharacterized protein n=1 Tax=Emericellopsis atlantica TaxID=2614577 RepID=A0A9P8CP66_9HYPO|nr:uncharacterized protein F5Z01DRAFT_228582 [Emericellopsis atlantica]KAG9252451.1 hypothetical protein F5Z01DRAFT_228582 [Emericellopsis atlantica]
MANLERQGKEYAGQVASRLVQVALGDRKNQPRPKTKKGEDVVVEEIIRVAAAGVGLVSEAIKYRKEKKALQERNSMPDAGHEQPSPEPRSQHEAQDGNAECLTSQLQETISEPGAGDATASNEDQETAKDAVDGQSKKKKKKEKKKNALQLADEFVQRYPFSPPLDTDAPRSKLALPVILPQRRPKSRSRGFVRAYAPALADVGIEQDCFLDCVDALNLSMVPNEWFQAFNLAGFADVILMEPLLTLASIALHVATDAAIEAQSRYRSNKFLDRVNADFFAPRGLVAFVATWKPDSTDQVVSMDFEGEPAPPDKQPPKATSFVDKLKELERVTSSKDAQRRMMKQVEHKIRPHSGPIGGLEPAPLVFPVPKSPPDQVEGGRNSDKKKKKKARGISRAGVWLDEHMDRHSQAKWREENPKLPMAQMLPAPQFRSRYADPNHAAASGSFIDLVTGGRWAVGKDPRMTKEEELEATREQCDNSTREERDEKEREKRERDSMGWMSLIKMDVMYLVVCNIPTEQEMQTVRRYMHGGTPEC